jgi:mannose-6-phosphate isomerase-like protein (cupin superfamily)
VGERGAMMTSFIISAIGILFLFVFYKISIYRLNQIRGLTDKKFSELATKWNEDILDLINKYGLENLDLSYESPIDLKKKFSDPTKVISIGSKIDKGYDFYHSKFKAGYCLDDHIHNGASEFYYVLCGEIEVIIGGMYESILKSGDCLYVPPGVRHTIKCRKKANVITIALPSLFFNKRA